MQKYLVHEFVEDYEDGLMSRRDMVSRVLKITGSAAASASVLTALGVKAGGAQESTPVMPDGPQSPLSVAEGDPRVVTDEITFPGGDGEMVMAYQAKPASAAGTPEAGTPAATAPFPVVLICHENRGLTPHIHDIARRFAVNGYLACALDLLSREGGTAAIADPSSIPAILTDGDPSRHVDDFQAAITHYGTDSEADTSRIGMNGFCFGGGITWRAATAIAELKAAVPFYGPPPPLDAVPNIQAAVLGVYSDDPNDFANEGLDDLRTALEEAGITHQINVYPDSQHAFHNDTGQRYSEAAALAAWSDTLAWFDQYLA
jgi:carboxymethylenebutenolidase